MLRLKGDALGGGSVRGQVILSGADGIQLVTEDEGMRLLSASGDHLSNSVFVFRGNPSPDAIMAAIGDPSRISGCAVIIEHGSAAVAGKVSELGMAGVSSIMPDYFKGGDRVKVGGNDGIVEVEDVRAREVVSCLVQSYGKTLILKRSQEVGSWQGKWAAVSGYIEEGETPMETAFKEIREELSVANPTLVRKGPPLVTRKEGIVWISHPFLFNLSGGESEIKIDWEHSDYRWIELSELPGFDIVPGLVRMISALGLS